MAKPRILFITPAASRSGAPILMLHLIRWLKQFADFEMSVVLFTDGVMVPDFTALMPTEIYMPTEPRPSAPVRWLRRQPPIARRRERARVARCQKVVGNWPPDLVFCNSASAAGVLDALGPFSCPVVFSVHELEYVLNAIDWVPGGAAAAMTRHATHYIAGSHAVRANLIARHGASPDRISVIHDFIPTADFPARNAAVSLDAQILGKLGIPADAKVLGAIATVEWRKGADLLVPLAIDLLGRPSNHPIHLIWVGGGSAAEVAQLKFDVATAGLSDRVHIVGSTAKTADWYPAFTAFALLSREDPFPLVALEAAASGVPVLCFAGGGGMPEFVEQDCGAIVPYLNLAAFAEAVHRLLNDPALSNSMGQAAAAKVRARHDVSVAGPMVLDCMQQALGSRR